MPLEMSHKRKRYLSNKSLHEGCFSMRNPVSLFFCLLFFTALLFPDILNASSPAEEYAGAETCRSCHEKEYDAWKKSGHAQIIVDSSDIDINPLLFPAGYSQKNVSYVLGGYKWKRLFLDRNGYIVTKAENGAGKNQYNIRSRTWTDYYPGEKISYACGRCHTTGFSQQGHQKGLQGILGTWRFNGIQCEACHGPGFNHSRTTLKTDIKISPDTCSKCHGKEPLDVIPLEGVFLEKYTEVNQLLKSGMKDFSCTVCHNPHTSPETLIKQSCESCHMKVASDYQESYMYRVGVKCIDCHMPPAGKIAEGRPEIFQGDFKSHLFLIEHLKPFPSIEKGGKKVNPGYLSVDYACMRCHASNYNRKWATRSAMFSHTVKVTANIKIINLQRVTTYVAFSFTFIALLSGLYLKNYIFSSIQMSKKTILKYHRLSAWISFSTFVFNTILCVYFHFPLEQPMKALDLGWFLVHPMNGILMAIMYIGKIITVRTLKKGWKLQGLLWGIGIFLTWSIQFVTVILKAYFPR